MALQQTASNKQLIREINQLLVLNVVRQQGPISRTHVAEKVRLSAATISDITNEMISQGLVFEQEEGVSTGGRRPILLAFNQQAGFVIGAKLTGEHIVAALTDLGSSVVDQQVVPLPDDRRPEAIVETLAALVHDFKVRHPHARFLGLGLGLAGVIDREHGMCRFTPFFPWRNMPLRDMLEQRLALPVVIENDVNTLTIAEQWFGAAKDTPHFLVITLGRGIGMGMVMNGQLYRPGGEFGHLTVVPGGPLCRCGKRGCLETMVAEPGLLSRLASSLGREVTMDEAILLAQQGDATVSGVFAAAGRTLGAAVAHLVNIFNPPVLVMSGEGVVTLDILLEPFRETLEAECFNGFYSELHFVVERGGDERWARGAACLMLDELFRPTLHHFILSPNLLRTASEVSGRFGG